MGCIQVSEITNKVSILVNVHTQIFAEFEFLFYWVNILGVGLFGYTLTV